MSASLITPVQMVSTFNRLKASPAVVLAANPHSATSDTRGTTSRVAILNRMDLPDAMTPAPVERSRERIALGSGDIFSHS
jgi:hypothetical protein